MYRIFTLLFLLLSSPAWAQQNFTPLAQGDYKIVNESEDYDPKMRFSGSFEAGYSTRRNSIATSSGAEPSMSQEIEISLNRCLIDIYMSKQRWAIRKQP